MSNYEILTASSPDHEFLTSEIWLDNKLIALFERETGKIEVTFYAEDKNVVHDAEKFMIAFQDAKNRLNY